MFSPTGEVVTRPGVSVALARVVADVVDTKLCPLPEVIVASRTDLSAYVHFSAPLPPITGNQMRNVSS